jgi:hypothetical protein
MDDPQEIYLQPWCDECERSGHHDGRMWCEDDVWGECEEGCGRKSVKYVLATDGAPLGRPSPE